MVLEQTTEEPYAEKNKSWPLPCNHTENLTQNGSQI